MRFRPIWTKLRPIRARMDLFGLFRPGLCEVYAYLGRFRCVWYGPIETRKIEKKVKKRRVAYFQSKTARLNFLKNFFFEFFT